MKFKKLRIAWSVVCGIICVLLIALWVRSHRVCDTVIWNGGRRVVFFSGHGQVRVSMSNTTFAGAPLLRWLPGITMMPDGIGPWYFQRSRDSIFLVFPHRLPIAVLALFAVVPWIHELRWRFSLRTLLIAMTLVTILLGLIVWLR
jgi:hypothetical protein